jgi:O-acetyl-ADP-ribose deacetylase (regulator of RNase III)
MQIMKGNLINLMLQQKFDVIVHGCNCFHSMEHGLSRDLVKLFPDVRIVDRATNMGDRGKLGTFTTVQTPCGTVVNAYTQYYGDKRAGNPFDYEAFEMVLANLDKTYKHGTIYGFPLIGCGTGGASETKVLRILAQWAVGKEVFVVCIN